jgi:DNA-binding NarL/FixJ family response regulator
MDKPSERSAVLLDPYPLWHEAVSQVLGRIGVEVVEATASPRRALTVLEERPVDMVILEVSTADSALDGITFLRQAREKRPGLRAIVLSSYEDAEHIDAALAAGAAAYVVKTAHPDDLASAVRQVFAHSIYMPGERAPAPAAPETGRQSQELSGLTRRELEILQLVSEGHSNAQLARMLWVTEQTVKFHLSNIYRKLDVANRTEASRWAQLNGLLQPQSSPSSTLAHAGAA